MPERISTELPDDVDALRKLVLELQSTLDEKQSTIAEQRSVIETKQSLIDQLEEWVRLLRSQKFGRSSERAIDPEQPGLFNEAEVSCDAELREPESVEVPSHTRRKKGRAALPASLERIEVLHDLPEDEKRCPRDGHALERIGEERSEQLEVIPAAAHVLVHVRPKYACPNCHEGVKTAPMPAQPIPKSIASPGLLAFVTVSKYADGLPLYRLEGILERCGVLLPRSTLASWMIRAGDLVQPLLNLLRDEMHDYGFLQCDETPFQVLKEPGRKATTKSYLWAQRGGPRDRPIVLYDYAPSRGTEVPLSLLEGYEGAFQTDGYVVYDEVASKYGLRHYGCWAHARRKFVDALKGQKSKKSKRKSPKSAKAEQALRLIERLYEIEKAGRELDDEGRKALREERSTPILDELRGWLIRTLGTVPDKSLTGEALRYLNGQWPKLVRYVEDGRVAMDTNGVENAIRPFVIGRKNWLFSDTPKGAHASANLYSLIVTARQNGIEPYEYLRLVYAELPKAASVDDIERLLPWNAGTRRIGQREENGVH